MVTLLYPPAVYSTVPIAGTQRVGSMHSPDLNLHLQISLKQAMKIKIITKQLHLS